MNYEELINEKTSNVNHDQFLNICGVFLTKYKNSIEKNLKSLSSINILYNTTL